MPVPREDMVQELRKAEQAQKLLSEVERRLGGGNLGEVIQNWRSCLDSLSSWGEPCRRRTP
jgi:hypothetical protein